MSIKRFLLIAAGTILLGLGVVGAFVPILPTTPFVLAAAACYGSSSRRLHARLKKTKYFGEYIDNMENRTGITRKTRAVSLLFLWAVLALSAVLSGNTAAYILLAAVGTAVSIHILTIRRGKKPHEPQKREDTP
ncbi:MAG: YbaN family protein [Christensenellales bacterium]